MNNDDENIKPPVASTVQVPPLPAEAVAQVNARQRAASEPSDLRFGGFKQAEDNRAARALARKRHK